MTEDQNTISVLVHSGGGMRGGETTREAVPLRKLASEVGTFVKDIGEILKSAAQTVGGNTALTEVTVMASVELGGKLSLLGTGLETKGLAGITFKFTISPTGPPT